MYKHFIKPILFLFSAETAHRITFALFSILTKVPGFLYMVEKLCTQNHPSLERELFGIKFKNPVGLAAGFDKNAVLIDGFAALGFGFIEIGTVTPLAQDGNPKPRLFRLKADRGIINRMGFNNKGMEHAIQNLKMRKNKVVVGGNIGKNKVTDNNDAVQDYSKCFEALYPYVDYFVVNVSSPNTPNLRDLQEKEPLKKLLTSLQILNSGKKSPKPILLKIAPDLTETQLDDVVEIVFETKLAGVIATNTTIARDHLTTDKEYTERIGAGGLSGKPLHKRALAVVAYIHEKSNGKIPIIGVGGVDSPHAAEAMFRAGASLVQIYTGLVYEGPMVIRRINSHLAKVIRN